MKQLHAISDKNQEEARAVIEELGLRPAWENAGAKVNLVGSLATGLLMTHKDIDFHIYTETLDVAQSFDVMGKIARNPKVIHVTFTNLAETEEACLEWHINYQYNSSSCWQIDIIQILKGSQFDGYFEHVATRIQEVLTPETRDAILKLKYQTPSEQSIMGISYYQAVIEGGVRDWDAFMSWLDAHPATGINLWCP